MCPTAPRPRFRRFHFSSIYLALFLSAPAHPRNIPPRAPAHKWKTVFLPTFVPDALFPLPSRITSAIEIFYFSLHKSFLLPQTILR
jgi:hypothetical protein